MTLFTITGHLAFHFCIAVANLVFTYTLIAKTPFMFHVRPLTQKLDSFACFIMEFTTIKNNRDFLTKNQYEN